MSKLVVRLCGLVLPLLCLSARAVEENPYKSAKVGDWIEHSSSTVTQMGNMTGKNKTTVTAMTDKEATLKLDIEAMGVKQSQEVKVPLDKPYDPNAVPGADAKVEKLEEGDEKVTVGGKSYDCHWIRAKITLIANGANTTGESKSWICKEVPMGGLVKGETNVTAKMGEVSIQMKSTLELTGCGSAP